MKKTLIIFLLIISAVTNAQTVLTVTGQTITNSSTGTWSGYDVARTVPTTFTFSNNSVTSVNTSGYMLQAGDEAVDSKNNNLDGMVITGNRFTWNGVHQAQYITHGIFTGCNINADIRYNYCDNVPMSIIRKAASDMTNTSGGVAYNVVREPTAVGGVVKGMSGVVFYNNTFYSSQPTYSGATSPGTWRGIIDIYINTDATPNVIPINTKIKNNIFYTVYQIYNVKIEEADDLTGFECDYNLYYCESGTPMFSYLGSDKTFAEWQALGFDTHSVVVNPNFNNTTALIPNARLNYGTNLGSTWQTGLSTVATWSVGSTPSKTDQNGFWQVGAYVHAGSTVIPTVTTTLITSITTTTSSGGGNVTSDGGATVTARGVCWGTAASPTISNSKTTDGTGTGAFTSNLTGLTASTLYYVRAYATNSIGTSYGSQTSFTSSSVGATTYYISPTGSDGNSGTIGSPWFTLNKAWTVVSAGDIVCMRGGTYSYTSTQSLSGRNGDSGSPIKIWAYTGETPVITRGSGFSFSGSFKPLIYFSGNYIHWKGISITGNTQLNGTDIHVGIFAHTSNNCTFELLKIYGNGMGFWLNDQISGANSNNNLFLNCDIYENEDPLTSPAYGNGDGLGININAGNTVTIRGCRLWYNSDDGIDPYGSDATVIIDKCWTFYNGLEIGTFNWQSDANGIKYGGTNADHGNTILYYTTNCISYRNGWIGYNTNGALAAVAAYNNISALNGTDGSRAASKGFQFNDPAGRAHILRNNISYNDQNSNSISSTSTVDHNTFLIGGGANSAYTLTSGSFASLDASQLTAARQSDGSLPIMTFLHLAQGSNLIHTGVTISGLTTDGDGNYFGTPDPSLGPFEYSYGGSASIPTITTTDISGITTTTASSGGNVVSDGGATVTARGVCWSTAANPTTSGNHTSDGSGVGTFTSAITGLTASTIYHVRAYASNSAGTAYGADMQFTSAVITSTYILNDPATGKIYTSGGKILVVTK
jgi:hypothetical protein